MSIPINITSDHIDKAIDQIIPESIPKERLSYNYFLISEGEQYPPKYVISKANKFANKIELSSSNFNAVEAVKYLRKLNYHVQKEEELVNIKLYDIHGASTIENYRTLITPDDNYFYWDSKRFTRNDIGDIVFWVNRTEGVVLYTKIESKDVTPKFSNGKNLINDKGYSVSAAAQDANQFENFYRFKIVDKISMPEGWNYSNLVPFNGQTMAIILYEPKIKEPEKKIEKIIDLKAVFVDVEEPYNVLTNAESLLNNGNAKIKKSSKSKVEIKKEKMNYPLNTILYGPPGTGKTYHTVLRAAEIIEDRKIDSFEEALSIFNANLHDRIEFITFHQNYSYEDFIQGLRPDTDNSSSLLFEKKDGVFKNIVDRAKHNPYFIPVDTKLRDYTVIKSNKDIVELWSDKTKSIRYVPYQLIKDLINGINSNKISLDDIKKRRDLDLPVLIGSKVEKYYFGIESTLFNICEFLIDQSREDKNLNYVIIIDEINRANISRVFGELITLIEPDKRSNGGFPMEARLPSGDSFIVPSNLYIIGTMNTADKSIALLDIALRRRFEFESMYPKYEIQDHKIYDVDILKKINDKIIKSKGHDFQIGHAYFMGDQKDLVKRMNKKVIPLLLEYYMNDEKEVKGILQYAGLKIDEESWPIRITGKND